MRKHEIEIGKSYVARISGNFVPVMIMEPHTRGGWHGKNMATGRMVRIKSAGKLRKEYTN